MTEGDPGDEVKQQRVEHVKVFEGTYDQEVPGRIVETNVKSRKRSSGPGDLLHRVEVVKYISSDVPVSHTRFFDRVLEACHVVADNTGILPTEIYLSDRELQEILLCTWFNERAMYMNTWAREKDQGISYREHKRRLLASILNMDVFIRPTTLVMGSDSGIPYVKAYSKPY